MSDTPDTGADTGAVTPDDTGRDTPPDTPADTPAPAGPEREHTVSVRLTDPEWRSWWTAARAAGRRELAPWVRAVLAYVIEEYRVGERPGSRTIADRMEPAEVEQITAAAGALNSATARSHGVGIVSTSAVDHLRVVAGMARATAHRVAQGDEASAAAETQRIASASRGTIPDTERQRKLVQVRASGAEVERWAAEAAAEGINRVSGWVRVMVSGVVGWHFPTIWRPRDTPRRSEAARQVGGAITNAAQLAQLAEATDAPAPVRGRIAADHAALAEARALILRPPHARHSGHHAAADPHQAPDGGRR